MENSRIEESRLTQLRKERNLSQQELGEQLFMSRRQISNMEGGGFSLSSLIGVADYFGVSIDYILERTDERYSAPKCADETEIALWQHIKTMSNSEKERLLKHLELENSLKSGSR